MVTQVDAIRRPLGFNVSQGKKAPGGDLVESNEALRAEGFLPSDVIVVAECISNSLVCLATSSRHAGVVFYWNYSWRYPWSERWFRRRLAWTKRLISHLAATHSGSTNASSWNQADMLSYATLVPIAPSFDAWLHSLHA